MTLNHAFVFGLGFSLASLSAHAGPRVSPDLHHIELISDSRLVNAKSVGNRTLADDESSASNTSGGSPGIAAVPTGNLPAGTNVKASAELSGDEGPGGTFQADYFGVVYGPSIANPGSRFQPTPYGEKDPDRPVFVRSFLDVGYNVTDEISVAPTVSWLNVAQAGEQFMWQDPYLRVADTSLWSNRDWNWYVDGRVYFPATADSRAADMKVGFQTFQALTYNVPATPLSFTMYGAVRGNFYGNQGVGDDFEVYLAPNANYQFAEHASVLLTYEMGAAHQLGQQSFHFNNEGTALEPSVAWDVTPTLEINPFLAINTGGAVSFTSTSCGMIFSWKMM